MKILIDTNVLNSTIWRDNNPERTTPWVLAEPDWEWIVSSETAGISTE